MFELMVSSTIMCPSTIMISGSLTCGGVQTQISELCRLLCGQGASVTACGTNTEWPEASLQNLRDLGARICIPRWGRLQALATWPILLRRQYDVMYCIGQGRMHGWLKRRVLRTGGTAIYHEILDCPRPGSVAEREMRHMDAIVANSSLVGRDMADRWPSLPVRIVPFLTAGHAVSEPGPRAAVGQRPLRVVYLGRLALHKRPQVLIRQWSAITAQPPLGPARLDIYGDDVNPDTLQALRKEVAMLGMEDSITLHGAYAHRDLPAILAQADVVVLPSEWEGLPLVLIEAMQRGVPVVATNVGGTVELGLDNPDVIVTDADWESFVTGLRNMADRLRRGAINAVRLHRWTESRYGYTAVSTLWKSAILNPHEFFSMVPKPASAEVCQHGT